MLAITLSSLDATLKDYQYNCSEHRPALCFPNESTFPIPSVAQCWKSCNYLVVHPKSPAVNADYRVTQWELRILWQDVEPRGPYPEVCAGPTWGSCGHPDGLFSLITR